MEQGGVSPALLLVSDPDFYFSNVIFRDSL